MMREKTLATLLLALLWLLAAHEVEAFLTAPMLTQNQQKHLGYKGTSNIDNGAAASDDKNDNNDTYDLVIVGAGASGLFASGAAVSFGLKTLLLDKGNGYVGGDCSNAACVPSKALRSVARMAAAAATVDDKIIFTDSTERGGSNIKYRNFVSQARDHISKTVMAVRQREDIRNFDNVTNLDLQLVQKARFVSKDQMEIVPLSDPNNNIRTITSRKFLIATGAPPIIPSEWQNNAKKSGLPLYSYRDILSPDDTEKESVFWKQLGNTTATMAATPSRILIAGGGPTAVELGQSLARLQLNVTIVAPTLLAAEDVALQQAACKILRKDGATLVLGKKVKTVSSATAKKEVILDDGSTIHTDALIACIGRQPTLDDLGLDAAGIAWNESLGLHVYPHSLRSRTNPRVFACGDCCSAVRGKDRKAAHAAWTGYHAIRNLALPRLLWWGSPSLNPTIPSVTYADPELASVGMTRSECIKVFGQEGFVYQSVREEGNDRADMERMERYTDANFVELRAQTISGRILGISACGPAAAELANEVGLAIRSKLTVRELARSIHSYPSHGYLLYRLALSMALSSTIGFLDTLGPICRVVGRLYGFVSRIVVSLHPTRVLPWMRRRRRNRRLWEAVGQQNVIYEGVQGKEMPVSFLDYYNDKQQSSKWSDAEVPNRFSEWVESKP